MEHVRLRGRGDHGVRPGPDPTRVGDDLQQPPDRVAQPVQAHRWLGRQDGLLRVQAEDAADAPSDGRRAAVGAPIEMRRSRSMRLSRTPAAQLSPRRAGPRPAQARMRTVWPSSARVRAVRSCRESNWNVLATTRVTWRPRRGPGSASATQQPTQHQQHGDGRRHAPPVEQHRRPDRTPAEPRPGGRSRRWSSTWSAATAPTAPCSRWTSVPRTKPLAPWLMVDGRARHARRRRLVRLDVGRADARGARLGHPDVARLGLGDGRRTGHEPCRRRATAGGAWREALDLVPGLLGGPVLGLLRGGALVPPRRLRASDAVRASTAGVVRGLG